jgi:hypothetical protein
MLIDCLQVTDTGLRVSQHCVTEFFQQACVTNKEMEIQSLDQDRQHASGLAHCCIPDAKNDAQDIIEAL